MDRKLNKILVALVVLTLNVILILGQNYRILNGLRTGKFLAVLKPHIILSADAPWESLPPSIKEYISATAALDTKLDKADILQLSKYYQDLANNYKEPIVLRDVKNYPIKREVAK